MVSEPGTGVSSGSSLVVYFSATGHTERVANYISEATGADVFTIEPSVPYSTEDLNYCGPESRVSVEHSEPALQNIELVSSSVERWDEYDTVYIGYPIWWGGADWPVSTFVSLNSFAGKTAIPFCTSASSGAGSSSADLTELAGNGNWLGCTRFGSEVDENDVAEWLAQLEL